MSRVVQLLASKPVEKAWAVCALLGGTDRYLDLDTMYDFLLQAEHKAMCGERGAAYRYSLLDNPTGQQAWSQEIFAGAMSQAVDLGVVELLRYEGAPYFRAIPEQEMGLHSVRNSGTPRCFEDLIQQAQTKGIGHEKTR